MWKRLDDTLLMPAAMFAALAAASLPVATIAKAWSILASRPEPDVANGVMALVLGSLAVAVTALTQIQRMVADHVRSDTARSAIRLTPIAWGQPYVLHLRAGATVLMGTDAAVPPRPSADAVPAAVGS